ncbi:hypothetical protein Ciccas_014247 [Cichlidogyrus casuarinus]|uniref:Uncharacterized protein n=1 Tax=Cichlidogyrus casuarinus TaxID=1844966 RepID=A0ABD2PIQ0_9PLAT
MGYLVNFLPTAPIRAQNRTPGRHGTPGTDIFSPRGQFVKKNYCEQEYRVVRFNQIQELIQQEKGHVFKASQQLEKCFQAPTEAPALALTIRNLLTPRKGSSARKQKKRNAHGDLKLRWNGIGSKAHVECCVSLLLACQRRQALMEESAMLYDQSVPVRLGQDDSAPIKARLQLATIRLHLKRSDGCFALLKTESEARFVRDRDDKTVRFHIVALIRCHREVEVFQSHVATVMHMTDALDFNSKIQPASYVDLPCNVEVSHC